MLTPSETLDAMADTLDGFCATGLIMTKADMAGIARTLRLLRQQIDPPAPSPDTVVLKHIGITPGGMPCRELVGPASVVSIAQHPAWWERAEYAREQRT